MISFLRTNAPYLVAGVLLTFASSFGQTYFISIFAGRIRGEFGLSHGDWGGLYALATATSAFAMLWAGTLTDHFRVRALGPFALACLAAACISVAMSNTALGLAVIIFALRFFGQGMLSHIAIVAMARWYVARRGRALSIAGLGYAIGEAGLPITFVALMGVFDWRHLWLGAAAVCLGLIPVILALLRLERTPRAAASRSDSAGMEGRHWTRIQALSHPLLWLMIPSIVGPSAFLTALFFQQVHLAAVKGWTHAELVAIFPVYTGTGIAAMVTAGWALDRVGAARLIPLSQLPLSAGFLALWAAQSLSGAAAAFVLIGLSHGAASTLFSAFWAEAYGTRYLGGIKALIAALMVLGSAIGPGITGLAIDRGFDFPDQMPVIAVWFALASVLIVFGVRFVSGSVPRAA